MKTYLQLKTEIRNQIWPSGEAENLITAHDLFFEEAMAEIQKWVPCERDHNINTYPFCSTLFRCGLTAFTLPDGIIRRLYTIANNEWCDPVFYREKDWPEPEKAARNYFAVLPDAPANLGLPRLPQGFHFAEATTDSDMPFGRSRAGIWAKWPVDSRSRRAYLFPWIQSNETVVVEWSGIKNSWADTDPVNEAILMRQTVRHYVAFAHEVAYGSEQEARKHRALYDLALADMIHECKERQRRRNDLDYDDTRARLSAELTDDAPPDPAETVFAHIANYGNNSAVEQNISDLVRSFNPRYIITSGGNTRPTPNGGDYDADVGQFFHDFIFPYSGNYGDGSAVNMFWPAAGKNDWDVDTTLAAYKAFFRLPINERYYELVKGDVHFFFVDSDARDADGITAGSTQGLWLQTKLGLSTAAWKVVVLETPPYSSGATTGSTATLQWPFESWGADLVVAGKAGLYERITVGGISYLVNGAGGTALEALGSLVAGSQAQQNDDFGAIKFTVTPTLLKAEFWTRYGFLIDTLEVTQ